MSEALETAARDALIRAIDAALAAFNRPFTPAAEWQRKVARSMCEKRGYEPDQIVLSSGAPPIVGAKGVGILTGPLQPQWVVYWPDAGEAIEIAGCVAENRAPAS